MRAIILHAVRAKEFHNCKLEITKDLSKDVEMILCKIKHHFIAVKTNNDLIGEKVGAKQVRFQQKVKHDSVDEHPSSAQRNEIYVPPFPKDLADLLGGKAYYRLKKWRTLCNRQDTNADLVKKIKKGDYSLYRNKELKPGKKSQLKPEDETKKRKMTDRDDSPLRR